MRRVGRFIFKGSHLITVFQDHASPVRFRDLVRQAQGGPSCLEDSQSTMVEIATQREVGVEAVEGETEVPRKFI